MRNIKIKFFPLHVLTIFACASITYIQAHHLRALARLNAICSSIFVVVVLELCGLYPTQTICFNSNTNSIKAMNHFRIIFFYFKLNKNKIIEPTNNWHVRIHCPVGTAQRKWKLYCRMCVFFPGCRWEFYLHDVNVWRRVCKFEFNSIIVWTCH